VTSAKSTRMYLRSQGRRNPHQLFYGQREGMLLAHRRYVVEPVEIRDGLQVCLVFDQFFGPAMQQADMRIGALDDLAVHLEDKPHQRRAPPDAADRNSS